MAEGNGLPRVFTFRAEDFARLSFRDMIEASEAAGVDAMDIAHLSGTAKIRALAALTWVITRRSEPSLTYDEVLDGRVEQPESQAPLVEPGTGS